MKTSVMAVSALLLVGVAGTAQAHVCNVVLSKPAVTTTCDDVSYTPTVAADGTVSITDAQFTGYGWAAGTTPTLGDTHTLDGGAFYVFQLSKRQAVTISFVGVSPANFDAAFSLYRGLLPDDGHDDAAFDPLNPVDPNTFLPIASPTDASPYPSHHYVPLEEFRDTLNYSQTGGLGADGFPLHPFVGQFNAIDNWSLANESAVPGQAPGANWSKIDFLQYASCKGPGLKESLSVTLPAGDYTIAAGGANCDGSTTTCTSGPLYSAKVSVRFL